MSVESEEGPVLSLVVPCYNEQDVIPLTHARLTGALDALGLAYEIIYIDDGSRDRTAALLEEIAAASPKVGVLLLSRNFGHQAAVTAGLDAARGQAVVIIDADLQDPPELIGEMVARWRAGAEVVYGQRTDREGEGVFKVATAKAFYRLLNSVSQIEIPLDVGDFRLIDRKVVDAILDMRERDRFLRGMVAWVGFKQEAMPYHRQARAAGTTKYPLLRMARLATDGVMSFSLAPLRLAISVGMATLVIAILGIVYVVGIRLFTSHWVSGWAFIVITILFMGGVQLLVLGAIGEYVGRIYLEAKGRPLYLTRKRIGGGAP